MMLEPLQPLTIPFFYRPHFQLFVVGTGGTGGYVVQYLARLLYALQSTHATTVTLTLIDGDRVEEANLLRQHFLPQDVGQPKAQILADRFGAVYGLPVFAMPTYLTQASDLDAFITSDRQDRYAVWPNPSPYASLHTLPVLIGCVDNHATRQLLHQIFARFAHIVYIDAGNDGVYLSDDPADAETVRTSGYSGHVVIGAKLFGHVVLPPVGAVYPDILTDASSALPGQACGHQAVSQPQRMLTNVWAAMTVLSAINTLLADQQIRWHVANFHAQNAVCQAQALTPSIWAQWNTQEVLP
ncbi:ThiF family protein [Sulfobacillus thermosulfidooxidans DSM 9293]|uniref:ThiF family protein n=1 Tax=Sulfobacillus thermosulfidooxidans (strain DSM 9293 / VKM B-1269 / AT-1) TaxID=929705 RepID=A0A1W1WP46_SULTA|nr:ThiF family adenylyltransferase [Sulfobacillus thermosulfidooxidans]SMC08088.1 ThiF family protein [Sulfobacillus thermosulfidooxidans DSM 9293]